MVAGSWWETKVPAKEIPPVGAGCFLSKTHTCQERHSKREYKNIVLLKPILTGTLFSWSDILMKWHRKFRLVHRTPMRMAVLLMPKAQDAGSTWAWFYIALGVPAKKLWWEAWCLDWLLDHKPNDVTQKPQTCDVKLSSLEEVRLWTDASYSCWNDDFWLETRAIFSTYRRTRISPSEIHTHAMMILAGTLTSSQQLP